MTHHRKQTTVYTPSGAFPERKQRTVYRLAAVALVALALAVLMVAYINAGRIL